MNYLEDLQKTNWRLGIVLTVFSIVTCMASYFDIAADVVLTITVVLSIAIGFIAMLQVYNMGHWIRLETPFWLVYSSTASVVLVILIYLTGLHLIGERLSSSLLMGLSPMIVPSIGYFIGNFARVVMGKTQAF